jgi:hypothetical protein
MVAARTLRVLVLLVAAASCKSSTGDDAEIDAGDPLIMFEDFTPASWSLSVTGDRAQLSMTDAPTGATACGLSVDHQRTLGAAGVQIILHLPDPVTGPCPSGNYTMKECPTALGTAAYVPAGCVFYRKWDAQGKLVGIASTLTGNITVVGSATSCTFQVRLGFRSTGSSFGETLNLTDGASAQPWCGG